MKRLIGNFICHAVIDPPKDCIYNIIEQKEYNECLIYK